MSAAVLLLTTWPAETDAEAFARTLVEERLAACVNILPEMRSIYHWEGRVDQANERQVLIKTERGRVPALSDRIRALHPYEVPEIIVLPAIDGSERYLAWIAGSAQDGN